MGKKSKLKKMNKMNVESDRTPCFSEKPTMRPSVYTAILSILLIAVFITGVAIRINNLSNVIERSPDEMTYTYFAKTMFDHGVRDGTRSLLEEHRLNRETWIFWPPPPTRIGYLWLFTQVMKVTNNTGVESGAYISCFFSILSLILVAIIALRFFNIWIALPALLFMSVSPMELAVARRTWQDAVVGCVGLLLIYFCCEISRNAKKIIWYIFFVAIGTAYILIKESGIVIYGLCMLWVLWILLARERSILKSIILILFSMIGFILSAGILIYVSGGLIPLVKAIKIWKDAIPMNQYAMEYQSGPWYYFLQGIWLISPANTVFCSVGIIAMFLSIVRAQDIFSSENNINRSAAFGIMFFMIVFMTMAVATPHFQNLRYISVLFGPFYLISGFGIWYAISRLMSAFKGARLYLGTAICVVMVLIAVQDYKNFNKIFIKTGIKDISIKMVRDCA